VSKEFASLHKFHEKVYSKLILEDELHIDEERMVDCVQDVFLKLNAVHLLIFNYDVFSNTLHRIKLTWIFLLLHKVNFTKCSLSYQFFYFEIFKLCIYPTLTEKSLGSFSHRRINFTVNFCILKFLISFIIFSQFLVFIKVHLF